MTAKPIRFICAAALVLAAPSPAGAQDPGKTKDAALDSLLEELKKDGPGDAPQSKKAATKADPAQTKSPSDRVRSRTESERESRRRARTEASLNRQLRPDQAGIQGQAGASHPRIRHSMIFWANSARARTSPPRRSVAKEQGAGAGDPPRDKAAEDKGASKLGGKDKEIDARLEELAGRKRKRQGADDEQRSGPIGEMIKEMRDVEKRLGKPDTSEDTQAKQKQIVKRIDTLDRAGSSVRLVGGKAHDQAAAAAKEISPASRKAISPAHSPRVPSQ